MYFELISKESLEEFAGAKIYSVKDLQETSYANNGESLYLIKTEENKTLVRHYVNDFQWLNAKDVHNVTDLSFKWQGYILSKLKGSGVFETYKKSLENYYTRKYTRKISGKMVTDSNKINEALSSVLYYEEMYLNLKTVCAIEK